MHEDYTPAINALFALSLDHVRARTVLALWLFIRSCALAIRRIVMRIIIKGSAAPKAALPNGFVLPDLCHMGNIFVEVPWVEMH